MLGALSYCQRIPDGRPKVEVISIWETDTDCASDARTASRPSWVRVATAHKTLFQPTRGRRKRRVFAGRHRSEPQTPSKAHGHTASKTGCRLTLRKGKKHRVKDAQRRPKVRHIVSRLQKTILTRLYQRYRPFADIPLQPPQIELQRPRVYPGTMTIFPSAPSRTCSIARCISSNE